MKKVIDFLKKHDVICIQGNHDRYVFEGLENKTKYQALSVSCNSEPPPCKAAYVREYVCVHV